MKDNKQLLEDWSESTDSPETPRVIESKPIPKVTYVSNYKTEYRCEACHKPLSWQERYDNGGRCPICAHKGRMAFGIANTTEHAYREYQEGYIPRWYEFWLPKPEIKREYADES